MRAHKRFADLRGAGKRRFAVTLPGAILAALTLSAGAQDRLTGSDLAGVEFPEASRAWDGDPEGAKAATLDLAAGFAASQCGPTEFHIWQSVNETPDDIRQKTDDAFVAAGWTLETISRTDEGGRIHLARRGGDRLVMIWEPAAGAVGLLLCRVAGTNGGDQIADADPEEPEAAGDAMPGDDDLAAAEAGPGIAADIVIPRPRPSEEESGPPIEITPEVAALAQGVAAAAEALGPASPETDLTEADAAAGPLATAPDGQATHPPKLDDRLPGAEAADAVPQAVDREFTAALTPADAVVVAPPAQAIEPALAEIPDEAGQPPAAATEIGEIIAQSDADTLTDAVPGSASVVASGAAWRAALLVLALGLATTSVWLFRRRRPASQFASVGGWPKAIATILDSRVDTDGPDERRGSARFVPRIAYEFEAGGEVFRGERLRFGEVATADRAEAEEIVARYPPYAGVEVRFDPDDPANATLEVEETVPDPMLAAVIGAAATALAALFIALVA